MSHDPPSEKASPAQPARRPSRFLLAVGIAVFLTVVVGVALMAWMIIRALPPDVQNAASLRIGIQEGSNVELKYVTVDDPAEVQAVLQSIHVSAKERGYKGRLYGNHSIEFVYPSGRVIHAQFLDQTMLYFPAWGLFEVDEALYRKLCGIVSRAEGKQIELLPVRPK